MIGSFMVFFLKVYFCGFIPSKQEHDAVQFVALPVCQQNYGKPVLIFIKVGGRV